MTNLQKLVSPECVIPQLQASETEEVIQEMVDHLISLGRIAPEDREFLTDAVMEREQQIGTGVGSGVAIPHARIKGLTNVLAVIGRSVDGVEFQSPDFSPAKCICLLLVPEDQASAHLQTLAELAKVFGQSDLREQFLNADSAEEVCRLVTTGAA